MSSLLQKLEDNRTAILMAEIGAYLHDLGKARNEFIEHYAQNGGSGWDGHNFPSIFPNELKEVLSKSKVQICNEQISLLDFVEKHHKEKEGGGNLKDCEIPPLVRLLYAGWNGYDGMDSGLDKGGANVKQSKNNVFIATAFGYEPKENKIEIDANELTKELYDVVKDALSVYITTDNNIIKLRKAIIKSTKNHYLKFLGETRRSANDVTLWDHSYSVATLVKCAVAKNIINCSNASFDPLDFNWQILSVNFDTLGILAKSIKVGDASGYKKKIGEALNKAKLLIEEEYPCGNEIYRDTSGIYFLIPDIETKELKELILKDLSDIESELMSEITVKEATNLNYENYKFDCKDQQQIPSDIKSRRGCLEEEKKKALIKILPETRQTALQEISYPTSSTRFFSKKFADNWKDKEICPICRLRSMKENSDGCKHCLERRIGRAKYWIDKNPKQTIWLDEVSDHNDRVALLAGCFILDNWLDGSFIKTMAIAIRNNLSIPKNPSPARIRRCWETTQEFIKSTVLWDILTKFDYGSNSPNPEIRKKRIQFKINPNPNIPKGATLDTDLEGVRLSPVCIDENSGTFVSTVNLQILEKRGKTEERVASDMQGEKVKIKINSQWKDGFMVPEARRADDNFQDYLPYVQIYDSPDQFMVLVSAYDALDIAERILEQYEIQFSKVRDRLPFHIGIIAFHRRTPLYIAMDAGKRLISAFKNQSKTINAKVIKIDDIKDPKFSHKVRELSIQTDPCYSSAPLSCKISYSTGDPNQDDNWHPYIRFKGSNPNRGHYSFDYDGNGNYVVHVKELRCDDCIQIDTSYCKLFYLENASDRFRIDEKIRPINDIHRLKDLWKKIEDNLNSKKWSISQLYAFWQEVTKRKEDYKGDKVWRDFAKSAITNILEVIPKDNLFNEMLEATEDGLLNLCLHWYLQVRKLK